MHAIRDQSTKHTMKRIEKGVLKYIFLQCVRFLVGKLSNIHTLRQASNSITRPCFFIPIPKTFDTRTFKTSAIQYVIHISLYCLLSTSTIYISFNFIFILQPRERTLTNRGVNISHCLQIRHEVVHFISVGFSPHVRKIKRSL